MASHILSYKWVIQFFGDFKVGSGGRLNKKDRLTGYGDSHVKDKTSYRPSYL